MKKYIDLLIWIIIILGCNVSVAQDKPPNPFSIPIFEWKCLDTHEYLAFFKRYHVGVFFDPQHIKRHKTEIEVSIIPYLTEVQSGKKYLFFPAETGDSRVYVLWCRKDNEYKKYLNFYPRVFLEPIPNSSSPERSVLLQKLETYLKQRSMYDFVPPGQNIDMSLEFKYRRDGGYNAYYSRIPEPILTIADVIRPFFTRKQTAFFLNDWHLSEVEVLLDTAIQRIGFTYIPKRAPTPPPTTTPIPTPIPIPLKINWPEQWGRPSDIKNSQNCERMNTYPEKITCTDILNEGISLSWGKGWEPVLIPARELKQQKTYLVTLGHLFPKKPEASWFREDLEGRTPRQPCDFGWEYIPVRLTLRGCEDPCTRPISKEAAFPLELTTRFPNLREIDWSKNTVLPSEIALTLSSTSLNPSYYSERVAQWKLLTGAPDSLEQAVGSELIETLPVLIEPQNVPYDSRAKFMLFDSQNECESIVTTTDRPFHVYTAQDTQNITADACNWALVMRRDRVISHCAQGAKTAQEIVFRMESNQYPGRRLVVVVANSRELSVGWGRAVQRALVKWLSELKTRNACVPLNLFVVEENNEVKEILCGEDLSRLQVSSESSQIVEAILTNIRFDVEGLQPLRNISEVGKMFPRREVAKVLYFSDSRFLPQVIDDSQLGTLFGWREDNTLVTIVTESNCDKWWTRGLIDDCIQFGQYPGVTDIQNILYTIAR